MAMDSAAAERSIISGTLDPHSAMSVSLLRGVEGLVLHVEEYGDQPPETLTYRKSHSRIVAVGRKSSQGNPEQPDPERALFRCPVVSRKHAKITFTEYGNVCHNPFMVPPGLMYAEHPYSPSTPTPHFRIAQQRFTSPIYAPTMGRTSCVRVNSYRRP